MLGMRQFLETWETSSTMEGSKHSTSLKTQKEKRDGDDNEQKEDFDFGTRSGTHDEQAHSLPLTASSRHHTTHTATTNTSVLKRKEACIILH